MSEQPSSQQERLLFCGLFITLCFSAEAQQREKAPRVGYLSNTTRRHSLADEAFRESLRNLGYTEGENIIIEYRYADGNADRLPKLAAELVEMKVDVIVTSGAPARRQHYWSK